MTYDVTISPKFQIVIPKELRERWGFSVGQKVRWAEIDGALMLVPARDVDELIGALPPFDTRIDHEPGRSL